MKNAELLKKTRLFDGLTDDELERIAAGFCEESLQMGAVIIEENDLPKEMLYVVKDGEVTISTGLADSKNGHMLSTMSVGDTFGEISLIDDSPHSATVTALTDVTLLCMSSGHFYGLVEKDKNIGYNVMRNLAILICDRLRGANFAIKHFGFYGRPEDAAS